MFLITQIMDESRHLDVFRKRALANGGGLMQRPDINVTTSGVVGSIDLSRDFTEMSSRLHISGEGAVLTIFRMGELMAYNEAEKRIYRLAAQDESRHVAFGVMHMRYPGRDGAGAQGRDSRVPGRGRARTGGRQPEPGGARFGAERVSVHTAGRRPEELRRGLPQAARHTTKRQAKEYVQRIRSAGFGEAVREWQGPTRELMQYVRS